MGWIILFEGVVEGDTDIVGGFILFCLILFTPNNYGMEIEVKIFTFVESCVII